MDLNYSSGLAVQEYVSLGWRGGFIASRTWRVEEGVISQVSLVELQGSV
jgi:hypothetical protein